MNGPPDSERESARGEIPRATRCVACAICAPRGRFVFVAWGRALAGRKKTRKLKAGCDLPDGGECVALCQASSASAQCNSEIEIEE